MRIEDYYTSKYGEPERQAEFLSVEGKKVKIFKWNENQTKEGVTMYTTSGASSILGTDLDGCEFFLGITPAVDEVVHALAEVALNGNGKGDVPKNGDSIKLAFNLWKGTEIKSFLFAKGDEIISSRKFGLKDVNFIQLIPLFDSELEFKKKIGIDVFWQTFEQLRIPFWSSNRSPAGVDL